MHGGIASVLQESFDDQPIIDGYQWRRVDVFQTSTLDMISITLQIRCICMDGRVFTAKRSFDEVGLITNGVDRSITQLVQALFEMVRECKYQALPVAAQYIKA